MRETMGKRLKKLRKVEELRQIEVAEAVGMARSYLAQIENDRREGALAVLITLADFYDVSLDYLFKGNDQGKNVMDSSVTQIWRSLTDEQQKALLSLLKQFVN